MAIRRAVIGRIVLAALSLAVGATVVAREPDCESIEAIDVYGREFITEGVGYQSLKQGLVDGLLKQAVEQVIGKQITTNVRQELQIRNDDLESKLRELNVERAKGFIRGYNVHPPGEEIIEMGGQSLMQIGLTVSVCIPAYRGVNYVVAVGQILDRKGDTVHAGAIEAMIAEITKNPRFAAIRLPAPPDTYYDYELSARIMSASKKEVANIGGKLGASLLKALTNKRQQYDERVAQVTVELSVELEDVADRTISNFVGRGVETTKRRPNKSQESAAVAAALHEAAVDAVQKMMAEF